MPTASTQGLLEREHEVARLDAVLEAAAAGVGTAVLVEAAAGLGKTSLLRAAAALAEERGLAVLQARGGELERGLAFGIARDLLARRVASAPEPLRARLTSGAATVALPALGLAHNAGPPAEEAALRHGLSWLVADLADEQPLAVIVDDVQWADPASAAWLAHLARRVGDLPAAMLLAARPPSGEPEPPGLTALREFADIERLRPEPLGRASVAALVRSFYAPDADDRFIAACRHAAGGNPLHTHALLDAAAAQEIPANAEGATAVAELAPDAVRRSVAAGLRRAGEEAQALAKACAVLGEAVALRHAAVLAGVDPATAGAAADRLAEQEVLLPDRPLRFTHPVVAAAVRSELASGERARLHRHAAELAYEEGDVARAAAHLLEVDPAGDPRAAEILAAAAGVAAREGAMAHAAKLLERALAEPAPADQRGVLVGQLGRTRFLAGLDGAVDPLLAAAEALEDPDERGSLLATAVWAALRERTEDLHELARHVAELPTGTGEGRLRAEAAVLLTSSFLGRPPEPDVERISRARSLAGDSPAQRELLSAIAFAATVTGALPADALRSMALQALSSPEETLAPAAIASLAVAALLGPTEADMAAADAAIAACRRRGNQFGLGGLLGARSIALLTVGRLRDAEVDARTVMRDLNEQFVDTQITPLVLYHALAVFTARGLIADGQALVERHPASGFGAGLGAALLSFGAAVLAAETGDYRRAAAPLQAFQETLSRHGVHHHPWVPAHRVVIVEALVHAGDVDTAREIAAEELELAHKLGAPGPLGYALRAQGLAAGVPDGRPWLEQAVPLLERAGQRDRLARTLLDLGRFVRRAGSPAAAREPLRRALALAEDCGAELVAQRAFEELRASGAKPRRRELSGPGSLTPSEARIARLAADGHTNREIAQALFVSSKTVQTHLGHIYAKLAISGRHELAEALEPQVEARVA